MYGLLFQPHSTHYADLAFTTGSSPFAHPGHTGKGCQGKRRIQANAHIGSAGRCLTAEREAKVGYIYAAMQEFGINDHKIIERWERIYLEEGPEGLSVERRGRSSTGRSKKPPKEVEEYLLAEVQRLRAENDYLDYYNNRRIRAKLKGLPPAIHRQQALSAA